MKRFHLFILMMTMLFAGHGFTFAQTNDTAYYTAELESNGEIKQLLKRFQKNPTNLTTKEASKLYYGYATLPEFKGDAHTAQHEVSKLMRAKKFEEAFDACINGLKSYPTSLRLLYDMAYICQQLDKQAEKELYQWQFVSLSAAIFGSGNGSEEKPFHVVSISDEHCFVNHFGAKILDIKSIKTEERTLNKVETTPINKLIYKGSTIWFDITIAIKQFEKLFNEKN
ncbi:MAG: DUF4919 domain-containing protein [Alistipes sp.]|nr:DUF4919 domain-containing protein [Alistipes sp.]MBQ2703070.1 DUF4919 domain-containing protein [Alistipes sp.]